MTYQPLEKNSRRPYLSETGASIRVSSRLQVVARLLHLSDQPRFRELRQAPVATSTHVHLRIFLRYAVSG